jgi:LPS export ABC transporter protein LptC
MILRVLAAALGITAIVIGWLVLDGEQSATMLPAQSVPPPVRAGYSARDATLIQTGADGRGMYTVRASTITQEPGSPEIALQGVQLAFRDENGHLWDGRANQGLILDDAMRIDLTGAVSLTGLLPGSTTPAEITTEKLSMNRRNDLVTTRAPIALDWSGQRVRARGLTVHLKDQRLKLESDVHGSYSP